jgi:hypothetical protein
MIRIAISKAAFDAIGKTLPLGNVGYENATNENEGRTADLAGAARGRPPEGHARAEGKL